MLSRKVLSLTKPKGKIYKTKFLGYYITHILHIFLYIYTYLALEQFCWVGEENHIRFVLGGGGLRSRSTCLAGLSLLLGTWGVPKSGMPMEPRSFCYDRTCFDSCVTPHNKMIPCQIWLGVKSEKISYTSFFLYLCSSVVTRIIFWTLSNNGTWCLIIGVYWVIRNS